MPIMTGEALVIAARVFGERDMMLSLLCPERGLIRGLVKNSGKGKDALVMPFNRVGYEHYRRLPDQLGTLSLELVRSRAALWMGNSHKAFVLSYIGQLLAAILPEEHGYDGLMDVLERFLDGPMAWHDVLEFELFMLETVGYGLRLDDPVPCMEQSEIAYVSPTSGRAVPRAVARGYEERLLDLPACLGGPACAEKDDFRHAWRLTGFFLERALHGNTLVSRVRLGDYYANQIERCEDALAA